MTLMQQSVTCCRCQENTGYDMRPWSFLFALTNLLHRLEMFSGQRLIHVLLHICISDTPVTPQNTYMVEMKCNQRRFMNAGQEIIFGGTMGAFSAAPQTEGPFHLHHRVDRSAEITQSMFSCHFCH